MGEKEGGGGDRTVWYVLYCVYLYNTGCCSAPFIGVVENDGMNIRW